MGGPSLIGPWGGPTAAVDRTCDGLMLLAVAVFVAVPLGRVWGPADVVGHFLLQATVALAVAVAMAAARRRLRRAAVGCAILVASGLVLVPDLRPAGAVASGPTLRVLFANLHGHTRTFSVPELEAWLDATGADVVFLAEASHALMRGLEREGRRFPHVAHCHGRRYCETVLLARRALADVGYEVDAGDGGKVLMAELDVAGVPVTLAVTHVARPIMPNDPAHNFDQMQTVVRALADRERLILAGDFNAVPWGRSLAAARDGLHLEGRFLPGGTWPSSLPPGLRLHIDHVLVGCGLHLAALESRPFPGSDHLAVMGTVRIDVEASCPVSRSAVAAVR